MSPERPIDLVLSSGFLAFARQAGFLRAVEDAGLPVGGVCGTSSGALAGAMWAAGHSATAIARELSARRPVYWLRPNWRFWRGGFSLDAMVRKLEDILPPRFEDLRRPLGIGVMTLDRRGVLLTSGSLPHAVAASCAIPYLFAPVRVDGTWYADGGLVDRTALRAWRAFRGEVPVLLHFVEKSLSPQGEGDLAGVPMVRTPRSNAKLWNLGDFSGQLEEARRRADEVIGRLLGQRAAG